MKKLIPIVLIAVALFFIFNDGSGDNIFGGDKHGSSGKVLGSSDVPEAQLISDISASNHDIGSYGLSVTDIDVLSSDCDKDLGVYSYFVSYSATNADVNYSGNISLTYMKHNDVWSLSKYEDGDTAYEPKGNCGESMVKEYIQNAYKKLGVSDSAVMKLEYKKAAEDPNTIPDAVDNTSSWQAFSYTVSGKENSICSWSDSWHVSCFFDIESGWSVVDATRTRQSEKWDVCGKYTFKNDKVNMAVNISAFDLDYKNQTATVTYSWELTAYETDDYNWQIRPFNTKCGEGPLTVKCSLDEKGAYLLIDDTLVSHASTICIQARDFSRWGKGGRPDGSNGDGIGVWVDLCTYKGEIYRYSERMWLTKK
ncbi:MAG TPA: hypothetical protein DIT84_06095 [Clostridiales bacterium]|nr:hypothetical protein [Clostridiales bacterium]